jgi:hypothetical protein
MSAALPTQQPGASDETPMTPGSAARSVRRVADAVFNDRRLAEIYDPLDTCPPSGVPE